MHALRVTKPSRRSRREAPAVDGLVLSDLTELALGALTGWPMAIAVSRPQDLPKIGIRSGARLRPVALGPDHARQPDRRRVATRARPSAQGCGAARRRCLG